MSNETKDIKADVLKQIDSAAEFLSQAITQLHPSLDLYKELKEVDNMLDAVRDALKDGDYEL